MSSEDIYSRVPLLTDRQEIRILALAPDTGDNALRGDLFVESLDYDDLHYIALSYTWAVPIKESAIIIGGIPFHITENLERALRRIRGPSRPKNLWVDAICIDQDNPDEKSVQVSLMGNIYASATRTTVWLGEKSAQSDAAMDFIRSLRGDSHSYDSVTDQILTQAIIDLMRREWWTRVWVIQEALMSKRVIVMCGDQEVDLVYFIRLVQGNGFKDAFLTEDGPKKPQVLAKRSSPDKNPKKEFKHAKQLSEQPFLEILTSWYTYKQQAETSGLHLMDLTLLRHGFKASVQRDKIFALLGLATPEARSWIIPDYTDEMSHRFFLIKVTAYFLQFSARPLRLASLCPGTGCPSWVPDWTAIDNEVIKAMKNNKHGSEELPSPDSSTAKFNPQFEPPLQELTGYQEPSTLLMYGFIVDRAQIAVRIPSALDASGKHSKAAALSIKAKIREWESRMFKYLQSVRSSRGKFQGKTRWLKMARNYLRQRAALSDRELKASMINYLARHRTSGDRKISALKWYGQIKRLHKVEDGSKEFIKDYEEWMLWSGQEDCESCENKDYSSCSDCSRSRLAKGPQELGLSIVALNAGKTLFLTELGYHHVSNSVVNEGDTICSLWHTSPHFIIRRAEDECWTLVDQLIVENNYFWSPEWWFRDLETTSKNEVFRLK